MSSAVAEAVVIGRGFQLLSSHHFNHGIRCVSPQGNESVAVHFTAGSQHITAVCPIMPHGHTQNRVPLEKTVQHILYVKKYQVYVMFCLDLTLRVYSKTFQHIQTVPVTSTILCMEFVDCTSLLYTGESGSIKIWQLRQQLHCPIVPLNESTVHVGRDQWVMALDYEEDTEKVIAATENEVFIIDASIHVHQQRSSYASQHTSALTGAILFSHFGYLILSFKDGSINVLNTFLHAVVHHFSGHVKAVTAMKRHPMDSRFLSCSLDGAVRMWDLETLTECCRVEFGMEVIGMKITVQDCDTIQLVCHSYNDVKIWQHTQLESHFTSLNSHTVALSRIEANGTARVMAASEDGCVRLLSPVTGEVITIFFPVFTSKVLIEVLYCPLGSLLFALLTTGEVLVLSGHTNPCSTIELWTTQEKERIESMCMCIIEWKRKQFSLLFGGGVSGYIALLHSSYFTMPQPCPAHGGRVCRLVSSSSLVSLSTTTTSTPCLLSFGSDDFLNVWSLVVSKRGDHIQLKMQICIQMESIPKHIGILGTLLCVTTIKNSVKMLNISTELTTIHQNRHLPRGCLFNRMPILSHQREDCHTDTITSLCCCQSLGLFATSSRDGFLKVWSTSNQLVSEIYFGSSLTCACFSNVRGDLLVGFQRQLCIVHASNNLPSPYLEHSMEYCISDCVEDPITFDPNLEFWYDPERVPALPMQQEERSKYSTLNDYYIEASGKQTSSSGDTSSEQGREMNTSRSEVMDVQLTRRDSHHFLASLIESTSSMADISPLNKTDLAKDSLSSLRSSVLSALEAIQPHDLVSVPHKRQSLLSSSQTKAVVTPVKSFPAEVAPLQSTSSKLPIAPDCLIPNSTVRKLLGYIPPADIMILQQLPLPTSDKILSTTADGKPQNRFKNTNEQLDGIPATDITRSIEDNEEISSDTVINPESEVFTMFGDELEEGVEISESRVNLTASGELTPSPVQDLHHTATDDRSLPDRDDRDTLSDGKLSSQKMSDSSVHPSPAPHVIRDPSIICTATQPRLPISHYKESNIPVDPVHASLDSSPTVKTKVVPAVNIPFQMSPTPATITTTHTVQEDTSRATDIQQLTEAENEDSEGMKVLRRITNRVWFPRITADLTTEKEKVCDKIVSMLGTVNVAFIGDIGTALIELKRVSMLTEAQVSEMIQVLTSRLTSTECGRTKKALLVTLERLGVATDGVLLTILPHLMDTNMEVRSSAFSALKTVAGISNRSQLHHKLIELGVVQHIESNEDEILKDLSLRLKNKVSKGNRQHSKSTASHQSGRTSTGSNVPCLPDETNMDLRATDCQGSINSRDKQSTGSTPRRWNGEESPDHHHPVIERMVSTIDHSYTSEQFSSPQYRGSSREGGICLKENHYLKCADLAIFQARLQCQPIYMLPSITTTTSNRRSNQTRPIFTAKKDNNEVKRLLRLLATQPTLFSQTIPAREIIVKAYATRPRKPTGTAVRMEMQREFKWIKVFPVLQEASKIGRVGDKEENGQRESTRARTNAVVLPRLAINNRRSQCTYPAESLTASSARRDVIGLKLPHLN